MAQKLSPYKLSKMMALYFEGYSQSQIASKLKINQGTVSLHVTNLKSLAEEQGLKAATKEYGIMDEVESIHSLAAELKKAKLTAEESKAGLKMVSQLQHLGVKEEDYKDLIQACTKMKDEGYIDDAVKLSKLENATGMTHGEIIAEATSAHQDLEQTQAQVASISDKLKASREQLTDIENQIKLANQDLLTHLKKVESEKKQASHDLAAHMKQVGVDMNRLTLVEDLAIALVEGSVSNADMGQYIVRQKHLNQVGISLDNLVAIAKQVKVMTADDGGKALAEKLSEFGSLDAAIGVHQNKLSLLTQATTGLEEKAKLKAKIETDIVKLKAERAENESVVAELAAGEKKLAKTQHYVTDILHKQEALIQDIKQREERQSQLDKEIADKEQKVSDLSELEVKRNAVSATLAELEAEKKLKMMEREVFESFLGFVASSLSAEAIEQFVARAPQLIDHAKRKEYSPDLLRSVIIKDLSGGTLEIMRCNSCQARFYVDKPAQTFYTRHQCQHCGSPLVETDVAGPEIIKRALVALTPRIVVATAVTNPKGTPQNNPGQPESHN